MREKNKEVHKEHHRFNMSFDNLAIPEVNTKSMMTMGIMWGRMTRL